MSGRVAAIIPARYASTRLPAKPLLAETGKFLIQHVWERVKRARGLVRVVVATDDERIAAAVRSFGAEVAMTSPAHQSGTDRVAEVARTLDVDAVVNVQGDEPDLGIEDLENVARAVVAADDAIVTLAVPIRSAETYANPNAVKVVTDRTGRALYFSRSPIPWTNDAQQALASGLLKKHVGVYAFPREILFRFTATPPTTLERTERLEQLRALEHGIAIRVLDAAHDPIGIDTPEDYRRFVERVRGEPAAGPRGGERR